MCLEIVYFIKNLHVYFFKPVLCLHYQRKKTQLHKCCIISSQAGSINNYLKKTQHIWDCKDGEGGHPLNESLKRIRFFMYISVLFPKPSQALNILVCLIRDYVCKGKTPLRIIGVWEVCEYFMWLQMDWTLNFILSELPAERPNIWPFPCYAIENL